MERRCSERIKAGFKTEILYGNNTYTGTVENLSASGINLLTDILPPGVVFIDDTAVELRFMSPAGQTVSLHCNIMWSTKIPPQNVRHRIGMEIVELPWDKFGFL